MQQSLNLRLFFCMIICMLIYSAGNCQDAAPPVDNTLLERPDPLFVVEGNSGSELLSEISDTLENYGFEVVKLDNRDMQIESTRRLSSNREDYDKIIIWLERDFLLPEQFIKVYFLFGRYLEIVSSETRLRRIEVSGIDEQNYVGDLKRSLISISN